MARSLCWAAPLAKPYCPISEVKIAACMPALGMVRSAFRPVNSLALAHAGFLLVSVDDGSQHGVDDQDAYLRAYDYDAVPEQHLPEALREVEAHEAKGHREGTDDGGFLWPEPEPLTSNTLYDLASLTKPLVAAFLAVYLLEKKEWRLGNDVRRFFPAFPLPITLEQLLSHSAGLPSWHPFYLYRPLDDFTQIAALKNIAAPGTQVFYSDVGYILLRRLLEKTAGLEFQKMAAAIIFESLKLQDTFFLVPDAVKTRCAPTEIGNGYERNMCRAEHEEAAARFSWRTGLLRGEVHDANSFYSGGSAGNAGLFASARDLFKLSREFFPESATLLKADSIKLFWQNRTLWSVLHRSLGFKLNSSRPTAGGSALSKQAIGHSGFTGTSLWLEAETQRQWIILSNRIHPRVKKINFDALRRKLHGLLKSELNLP